MLCIPKHDMSAQQIRSCHMFCRGMWQTFCPNIIFIIIICIAYVRIVNVYCCMNKRKEKKPPKTIYTS